MAADPAGSAGMPGLRLAGGAGDCLPRCAQPGRAVTARDVSSALAMLSAEHRQVIVAMYYHHRPVAETADLLGIHPADVVLLASSAVRQLLRALGGTRNPCAQPARQLGRAAGL